MIAEYQEDDVAVCPKCGKEFELKNLSEEDINDFDIFFEHVSVCEE